MVCFDSAALNSGATLTIAPQHTYGRHSRAAGSYNHRLVPIAALIGLSDRLNADQPLTGG
jgi:hypothetical protein